jgi:beta-lactamase superfamily II metal-dependent hydrolase
MTRCRLRGFAALLALAAWALCPAPRSAQEAAPPPVAPSVPIPVASPEGPAAPAELPRATAPREIATPAGLELVFFDVRQGDSTLIRTPDGKNILVDGGVCKTGWDRFDAAEKAILPYLREEGITRLDLVIGTHPDFDHVGGLLTVVSDEGIEIDCYLDPGKEHETEVYHQLLKKVLSRKIPYRKGRTGMKLDFGKGVDAEILNPPKLLNSANDCSIVLRVQFGKVSFLLTGDAEGEAEILMKSRYGRKLSSTVLKAGHHGSKNSSGAVFLAMVKPKMVVISVGANNKFGHPHQEALDRFKRVGAKIYRTDEMGTIVMRTDGRNLTVSRRKIGASAPPAGEKR